MVSVEKENQCLLYAALTHWVQVLPVATAQHNIIYCFAVFGTEIVNFHCPVHLHESECQVRTFYDLILTLWMPQKIVGLNVTCAVTVMGYDRSGWSGLWRGRYNSEWRPWERLQPLYTSMSDETVYILWILRKCDLYRVMYLVLVPPTPHEVRYLKWPRAHKLFNQLW